MGPRLSTERLQRSTNCWAAELYPNIVALFGDCYRSLPNEQLDGAQPHLGHKSADSAGLNRAGFTILNAALMVEDIQRTKIGAAGKKDHM